MWAVCRPIRGRYDDFLRGEVADLAVLDVGCAEHDPTHLQRPEWPHRKLASWAVGVDFPGGGRGAACAGLGHPLPRRDLGDVIEHVTYPVALLRFAVRHLSSGGRIVARTPNAFYWRYCTRATRSSWPSGSASD
jgi:hypothetical protein